MSSAEILWVRAWPVPRAALDGAAAVVWIGAVADTAWLAGAVPPTAADRRDEARPASRREGFMARRLALRRLAADAAGIEPDRIVVAYDDRGRPCAAPVDGALFLSTANRGTRLGLAVSRRPVGLDLEPVDDRAEPPWSMLAATEAAALRALDPAAAWAAFLTLWTAKEAALKALGLGLAVEPREIVVTRTGPALALCRGGQELPTLAAESGLVVLPGGPVRASCVVLA